MISKSFNDFTNLLQEEVKPEEEPNIDDNKEEGDPNKKFPLTKPKHGIIGKPSDDLTLRAAMYGVLFQSYADQVSWSSGFTVKTYQVVLHACKWDVYVFLPYNQ